LFKEEYVSENVLKKLIRQNIVEEIVKKENSDQYLYRENTPCDFFILILQGKDTHCAKSITANDQYF
jgi:hypothetical protein